MASASAAASSGSRSRHQTRKKPNDDAAYMAPPSATAGTKRQATDKADGEPRVKRKRVDPITATASGTGKKDGEEQRRSSMVEFSKMPLSFLHSYMTQYDIVPDVWPSPLTAEDPPPPISLFHPHRHSPRVLSPPAHTTPANRPRRESKEQSRRRSSRLLEEENRSRTPILADVDEVQTVLACIVERHFREMPPINGRDEVDTLASFMCAIEKSKGLRIKR
ncbi:hypothetical protein AGABI1DRAFT_110318 [Agaricus bisporus var. burnettii JB137-S8]|uniref:Histone deacetylase complex subunit SAP30 Sin3 binding domain-containing protein n=2 Tax=Agaricus bisporus var. burnettii TaxID=192524 RepID=K5XJK3_AGABU|nr:uncharacterized protein AGABI1DRAFT_110318 [Agaricus bisporus var. burnettii JB137-S8]EKM83678.1 hypothetical protein AGABI1DRAFT_110318 [Agaricus bisporus var. burnettii JB137-S8]KAF7784510.1 hypothetical protein Agabi119p4_675 [Agaricus bisporus var. burnettii]